jgi:para-aminobenzoate synthetase component I
VNQAKRLLKHQISADELVEKLLDLSKSQPICLLDSCSVSHLGSHYLICGVNPLETYEITNEQSEKTLEFLDKKLVGDENFAIFTISYDFGLKLESIKPRKKDFSHTEPDVFLALFDCLIVHDYDTNETHLIGNKNSFDETEKLLFSIENKSEFSTFQHSENSNIESNFTKAEYFKKIENIKEFIRRGDTYQTNLTQQFRARLPENLSPQQIFYNLRKNHPAPFASFIQRTDSTVISASPERFFKVETCRSPHDGKGETISTSPIKGTRPRGKTVREDDELRHELQISEKDRAENVMIVDLLRNDLGRICEFGSVNVEKLCDLEKHPTLFHLVSTVSGKLRAKIKFSDIIRAVFPCGSITGAPKIRTMKLIDEIETANRGLSMGAIGGFVPSSEFQVSSHENDYLKLDLSVAIRTMTIKNRQAIFNVGGGIVIDSIPENEYEEMLIKAKSLLDSINANF